MLHCGMKKFSFTIEYDENTWTLETEGYINFMMELQSTLRDIGQIKEDATIAVLSPSSRQILDWAGECY
jgi:hypothetical protein